MRTLVYSSHGFDKPFLEAKADNKHLLSFTEQHLNADTIALAKGFEAVALFTSDNASAGILDELYLCGVRYIALRSAGYDHVDLIKAKQLGIRVANVPAYSPYAIAEHAVALLMAINRRLILGWQLMQQNDFRLDKLVGSDLHGKTVGIIGTGKIGMAFANIMNGFGCKIIAYDVEQNPELVSQAEVTYVPLNEVLQLSDIISVHCPLNKATTYLFDKNAFEKMKKGVLFINTARGGIVNTVDLIDALDKGIVGAAGLDVYENEKPIFFQDHSASAIKDELFQKLRSYPNVFITGHQAFLTNEALEGIAKTTIENLDMWSKNSVSDNEIS